MSDPLPFPSVHEIAAAKALARSCKHRVRRRGPSGSPGDKGLLSCLTCGSWQSPANGRWIAPTRVPRLRRIK